MDGNLTTLAGGALLLSVLHALIPNHWVPFVVLGRQRGWTPRRMAFVAFLGGTAHLASTILIGVVIGTLGLALSARFEGVLRWAAPAILLGAGLWVFFKGGHAHAHPHGSGEHGEPAHGHAKADGAHRHGKPDLRDVATVGTLCLMMFVSPCLELEAYYVVAARRGWLGIALVSLVYFVVAVSVMVALVMAAAHGMERLRADLLERYERYLSGGLLIVLGLIWMAVPL